MGKNEAPNNIAVGAYGRSANERALLVAHVAALASREIEFSLIDDTSGSGSFLVLVAAPVNLPFRDDGDRTSSGAPRYVLQAAGLYGPVA